MQNPHAGLSFVTSVPNVFLLTAQPMRFRRHLLLLTTSLLVFSVLRAQVELQYDPALEQTPAFQLAVEDFRAQLTKAYGQKITFVNSTLARTAQGKLPEPQTVIKLTLNPELPTSRPDVKYPMIEVPDGQFQWQFYDGQLVKNFAEAEVLQRDRGLMTGGDEVVQLVVDGDTTEMPMANYEEYETIKQIWEAAAPPASTSNLWLLEAKTLLGLANGLYALLQEQLGVQFVHPRQTIYPNYPLPGDTSVKNAPKTYDLPRLKGHFHGTPRFDKRGFHIHTQHPLEITEQLMNPQHPNALEDIKQYIDWLARNGQNVLQYYMLRGLDDMEAWGEHNAAFVKYAHERGIICGLKSSIHSIQQYAHQLVGKTKNLEKQKRQADESLEELFAADWDFLAIDLSKAEFLGDASKNMKELERHIANRMREQYGSKFFHVTHVINEENVGYGDKPDVDPDRGNPHVPSPYRLPDLADSVGCLIHSVMFYTLWDDYAPTYGNHNLHFMRDAAIEHAKVHETWYFPESAYWITFDNSIPANYLNYLHGRYTDIAFVDSIGLVGHSTFSSGWEWGYWLTDWSIARWSWHYDHSLTQSQFRLQRDCVGPLSRIHDLVVSPKKLDNGPSEDYNHRADTLILPRFRELMALQRYYLEDLNLMRFIAAQTILDQVGPKFRTPYHPQPEYRYKTLYKKFDLEQLEDVEINGVMQLKAFGRESRAIINELRWLVLAESYLEDAYLPEANYHVGKDKNGQLGYSNTNDACLGYPVVGDADTPVFFGDDAFCSISISPTKTPNRLDYPANMHTKYALILELLDAYEMTALRALHRATTLQYLINERKRKLGMYSKDEREEDNLLGEAEALRAEARAIVDHRKTAFRYDTHLLTGKRSSVTSYQFGYLYPADRLQFWRREEAQVRRKRFGPLFMNIWPIFRIIGIRGGR